MTTIDNSLYILIPARNEAQNLPRLLKGIKKNITDNIVVIDNNSIDQTFVIAKQYTNHVIREEKSGYGNACLTGISYLNSLIPLPERVCFVDGDGQSQVDDITTILTPFLSKKVKYCQGTRMTKISSRMHLTGSAYVANKIFSNFLSFVWRQKLTDLGPLRCIDLKLLNKLQMNSKSYAWTIEMNTKLLKCRVPIVEIPVNYQRRIFGKSKISGSFKTSIKAATIMSIVLVKTAVFWKANNV